MSVRDKIRTCIKIRLARNSRCSVVSANRTEMRLPGSFHPLTIRPCNRSIISSAPTRVSKLFERIHSQRNGGRPSERRGDSPNESNNTGGITEAGLEEAAAINAVRRYQR